MNIILSVNDDGYTVSYPCIDSSKDPRHPVTSNTRFGRGVCWAK